MAVQTLEHVSKATSKPVTATLSLHKRRANQIAIAVLSVFTVMGLFPYIFMLLTSVKNNAQFFDSYWLPALPFHFENFGIAWARLQGYVLNSIVIAVVSVLGVLLIGSVCAYVFAQHQFPGRNMLYTLMISLIMVPSISSLIPLFVLMRDLKWLNTYLVLIVPYIATGCVLATFLMRTYFEQIQEDIFEAARLDGASSGQIYLKILLPLSRPIIGTVSMLTAINIWNDYFWPLLTITDNRLRTLTIGLAFFQGQVVTEWGPLFAGYTLVSIPTLLLFVFASRYFVAGLQASSGG